MTTAVLLGLAALVIGFSKTSIGGLVSIAVVIFASVMPARESTAAILLLLITGDLVAVWHYRHDCDWSLLRRLLPAVIPGLVIGAAFLAFVDDAVLRRSIGVLLLLMALLSLWQHASGTRGEQVRGLGSGADTASRVHSRRASLGTGLVAGFTTMTANAAGAVMALYLTAQGVDKKRFLGTGACFFLGVNLCKVPFSAGLGLFGAATLTRTLALAPLVLVGAWGGLHAARRLSQSRFDQAILAATAISAVALIVH